MQKTTIAAVVGALAISAGASAQSILSFTFNSTAATYNTTTSRFIANNVINVGGTSTSGDVRRLINPVGTADYNAGFTAGGITVDLAVSAITAGSALGGGTLTIRDANNDTITAAVNGSFINGGAGIIFFNGTLGNVLLNNISGDGQFNGPSGGSFPLSFAGAANPPFSGALFTLTINSGNFFGGNFGPVDTQVGGQIVPAPASIALMGLGGLVAARRRRAR